MSAMRIRLPVGGCLVLSVICLSSSIVEGVSVQPDRRGSKSALVATKSDGLYPDTVVATILTGGCPWGAGLTLDGRYLYVPGEWSDSVSVIRTSDNAIVATFPLAGRPTDGVASPDGRHMYISNSLGHCVAKIRLSDNSIVHQTFVLSDPLSMALVQNDEYLYVTIFRARENHVAVIRTSDDPLVQYITVGHDPWGLAVTADGQHCYVSCGYSDTVFLVRTSDHTVESTIPVAGMPHGIALSPAEDFLYVVCRARGCVDVIRLSDRSTVASVPVGDHPEGLAMLPDGKYLYVSSSDSDYVAIIRTADYCVVKTLTVGRWPHAFTLLPDGSGLYVGAFDEGFVKLIGNIDVGSVAILSPTSTAESARVYQPRAVVRGFGLTSAVFPVTMSIGSGYSQTIQETLSSRLDTVVFPAWTAGPVGTLSVKCYTSLVGDEDPTNDTIVDSVQVLPPPFHDVGAVAIVSPSGSARAGDIVIPRARIRNFGNRVERFFDVRFRIGASYSEKVNVADALPAGSTAEVSFPPWVAEAGNWAVSCSTMLASDVNRANDKVSSSLRVFTQSLAIEPDQSDRLEAGKSKTYPFHAVIAGDTGGIVAVERPTSPPGWSVRLCDAAGANDLTDTDGDGIPDLGYVAPGESGWFSLDVTAPSKAQGDTASLGQGVFLVAGHVSDRPDIADTAVLSLVLLPEFSVHNFPNPFSGHTAFVLGLPEDGKASLTVYTRAGERVRRVLANANMQAGVHLVRWEGVNDNGRTLAPGTYEYLLDYVRAGKTDRIRKRLVLTRQ